MALLTVAKGPSVVIETVFENRFMHVGEFNRMGANIKTNGNCAIIPGDKSLQGAQVVATDLRAGAAVVLAGPCCRRDDRGVTDIPYRQRI